MFLKDVLAVKGSNVWTVSRNVTLQKALHILVKNHIGSLLVVDKGKVVGIVSERDIMRECNHKTHDWAYEFVEDVMTKEVLSLPPEANLNDAMSIMTENRIRHLPIVQQDDVVGIVSIGDVVKALLSETKIEMQYVKEYIASS